MKISTSITIIILITTILSCVRVLAEEPDWQTQNANLSSEQANTAKKNADTAAENADTAAQNASSAAQNANTTSQNANTAAQNVKNVNSTTTTMVTHVPAPKEVTVVPAGFVNCFVIKAGWFNGLWIPDHRVCKYNPSKEGIAWIEGYWACTRYKTTVNMNGECTHWDWKPGRWVRTFEVY